MDTPTADDRAPPPEAGATAAPVRGGPSPGGLAMLLIWICLGAALALVDTPPLVLFAFVLLGWVLSVMLHEFSHALVAWLGGDHTVATKGYLSFDPRRYGHWFTTVGIPLLAVALGGIGLPGGAVYLRNDLMRNRRWRMAASLAGPGANLLILLVLAGVRFAWAQAGASGPLFAALTVLAYLQATALILNLLPVPGLDGFNAVRPFLPERWAPTLHKIEGLALIALLAALFMLPGAGEALFTVAAALSLALGLIPEALSAGLQMFFFWR